MEASKLLWTATNWVIERNHEKEKMKKEMERKKKEEEIKKLGEKLREDEKEKERMKETLVGLGEEKREAIRQLCVWIDHHRGRCEYLEEVLSKTVVGRGQRPSQRA
ncbi:BnaA04g11430D [Brassica napus]|uniref:BnaA04g11430D protein n=2 Tax=Brassica TaxID=3705 RepID=A0A078IIT5_BRANA|nr:BnaA04g11430D [Brassica napus]